MHLCILCGGDMWDKLIDDLYGIHDVCNVSLMCALDSFIQNNSIKEKPVPKVDAVFSVLR